MTAHDLTLLRAIDFAADKHRFQRRKNSAATPYVNHVIHVAKILAEEGETHIDLLVAALLHDTVEDTETTFDEITTLFNAHVAEIVEQLTDDKQLSKEERKHLQIVTARKKSIEARKLKLADKISNVTDILYDPPHDWSLQRRIEYIKWANDVVDQMRGTHAGLEARFDNLYKEAASVFQF